VLGPLETEHAYMRYGEPNRVLMLDTPLTHSEGNMHM